MAEAIGGALQDVSHTPSLSCTVLYTVVYPITHLIIRSLILYDGPMHHYNAPLQAHIM